MSVKTSKPTLAITHPEVAAHWHPTKNKPLKPIGVTSGSGRKVWWKCPVADDHEWEASIQNRCLKKSGCSICANRTTVKSNCLATTHPGIASQWHSTKNRPLTPLNVNIGSHKKAWWKCDKGKDHVWRAIIDSRVKSNCPVCAGRKVVPSNCLSRTHPKIAREWHPIKNSGLKPRDFVAGSARKVWWQCRKNSDHEWATGIQNRTRIGTGCPCCSGKKVSSDNNLAVLYPKIAKQWHPTKNMPLKPTGVTSGSGRKVWWKCPVADDHEWKTVISNRTNSKNLTGCPMCAGKIAVKSNSLLTIYPKVAELWHPTKNTISPSDVVVHSSKRVWWKCSVAEDHEWIAQVSIVVGSKDTAFKGCSVCRGLTVVRSNCLETLRPDLAEQWHPSLNRKLKPSMVTLHAGKKVWWKCDVAEDHIYQMTIYNKSYGRGCPICAGYKLVKSNSLLSTHPEMSKEWHKQKNVDLLVKYNGKMVQAKPSNIYAGSYNKYWWKCPKSKDHIWKASVRNRTHPLLQTGCPFCGGQAVSTNESLSYNYPDLASEWHPFLNSSLTIKIRKGKETRSITPHSVSSGSSLKVWWQCSIDKTHVFQETIDNRAKKESGCPYCRLRGQSKEELTLLFELKSIFNRINPNGRKILTARRVQSVDIFIDDLSLAIEYDGAYWHKGSEEKDRRKSKALKDSKIKLIRLRQSPLKKVSRNDIIVDNPFNAKRTVDLILNKIENKYELKPSTKKKIKKYVSSEDLSAISERDNYIESHLIRK